MTRFTLVRDRWYACEFIGDEFDKDLCSYSPIKVLGLQPMNDGSRRLRLEFFHANYPAGVQGKVYTLQTMERGQRLLLTRSLDHEPARLLQIYDIDAAWVRRHFNFQRPPEADIGLDRWLNDNAY
jgi:hypothetical protein